MIEITNLSKFYKEQKALDNINLSIKKGEKIGIVGPNGSGKTTLCKIIADFISHDEGTITWDPEITFGMQLQEDRPAPCLSAYNYCKLYYQARRIPFDYQKIQDELILLKAQDIFTKPMTKLSGGEKQKLNLMLAILFDPNVVILDELGSGLDLTTKEDIYAFLDKKIVANDATTLILVSHDMNEIENMCEKIIFLRHGKIHFSHSIEDIKTKHGSLEKFISQEFKDYYKNIDAIAGPSPLASKWAKKIEQQKNKEKQ